MKNYYALWIVLVYFNGMSLIDISKNRKGLAGVILGGYVFLGLINIFCFKKPLKIIGTAEDENLLNVCDIFRANKAIICDRKEGYSPEEIEILRYVKNNIDLSKEDLELICDPMQMYWSYDLLKYINYEEWMSVFNKTHNPPEYKLSAKLLTAHEKVRKS